MTYTALALAFFAGGLFASARIKRWVGFPWRAEAVAALVSAVAAVLMVTL